MAVMAIAKRDVVGGRKSAWRYEFRGLSTDTKTDTMAGIECGNGDEFFEMDTSNVFMYDSENKKWVEI